MASLLLAGCGGESTPDSPAAEDTSVGHIHGLGIDPADDSLFVATHHGLFQLDGDGEPSRVADRWQDTMAFTVVGPNHFLASGHPDPSEDLPPHLGLIESTDAGETWTPLAGQGDMDFHVLEPAGDVLYGYDGVSGLLLRSEDRATFDPVLEGPLISVAATTADDPLVATDGQGQLIRIDPATGDVSALGGPTTVYLDTAADATLAGIDPDGVVRVSSDQGRSWEEVGSIDATPSAFLIADQGWYAATESSVLGSTDQGKTWTRVL